MGYYIHTTDVDFRIPTENLDKAYEAMCELNNHNHLKRGGQSPHPTPLPEGANEYVWFSWMPWNYPDEYKTAEEILDALGFETNMDGDGLAIWGYDSKMGNEDLFIKAIAPFVKPGSFIEWCGEEGEMWRQEFDGVSIKTRNAKVVWEDE